MFITTLISSVTSVIPSPTSQHLSTSFASFTPSFSFNTSLFSQGLNTVVPSTSGPSMFITTLISSDTSVIPSPTSQHLSTSFVNFTPSFSFNTSPFSQGLTTVVPSTSGPSMFITTLISSVTSVIPSPTSQHLSTSFASFTPSFSFNTSPFSQGLNTVVPSTSGPSMFITTLISSDTSVIPSPTSQHLSTSFASFTPSFSFNTSFFSQGLNTVVPSTSGPSMFITTLISSVTSVIPSPTNQHLSTSFASFTPSFSFNTSLFSQGLNTVVPSTSGPSMFITTLISSVTSVIPSPTSQHLSTSFASFTPSFSFNTSPFSQGLNTVVPSTSGPSMFITTLISSDTSVIPSPTSQHLSTSFASFTPSFSFNTSFFSQGLNTVVPSTSGPSMFITTLISSVTSVIPSPTNQHLSTSFASFTPSFSFNTSLFSQGLNTVVPSTSGPSMFITTLISSVTSVIPSPTGQHLSTSFARFTSSFSFNTSPFSQGLNIVVPSTSGPSMFITTLISSDTSVIPSPTSQHLSTSFASFTPSFSFNTSPFSQGLNTVVPSTSGPSMFITTLISSDTSVIPSPTSQHLSTSFASFTPSFSFNTSFFSQGLNTVVPSTSGPSMFITTLISSVTSVIPSPTNQHLSTSFASFTPSFSFNTSLFSQGLNTVVPSTSGPSMFITTLISSVTSVIPSPTGQHLSTSFARFTSSFSFNTSPFSQGLNIVVPSTSGPSMFITTLISSDTSVIPSPTSQHLSTSFASFTPSFSFNTSPFSQGLNTVVPSTSGPSMFITTLISSDTSVIPSPTSQHLSTSFASFTPSFSFNTSFFSQGLNTVVPSTSGPSMFITTLISSVTSVIPSPTNQHLSTSFASFTPSFSFNTSFFSQGLNTVVPSTSGPSMFITTLISSVTSVIPSPTGQHLSTSFARFTSSFSFNTSPFSQGLNIVVPSTSGPSMFITTLISSDTSVIPSPTSQHLSTSFASFTPSFSFNTSLFSQGLNTVVPSTSGPSMFITTLISSVTSVIPSPTSQHLSTSFASFTPSFSFNTSLFSQRLTTVVPSTSGPSMFITTLISSVTSVIPSPTGQHLSTSFARFTPSFSFNTSPFSQGLNTVVPSTSGPSMFITTLISSVTSVIPSPTSQHLSTSFASFTPSFSFNTSLFSQRLTTVVPSTTEPFMLITTLTSPETSTIPIPTSQLLSSIQFERVTPSVPFSTSLFSQTWTTVLHSTTKSFMYITTLIFSSDSSAIPIPSSQLLSSSQFESFTPSFSYNTSRFSQRLTSTSEPSMFITTLISSLTSVIPSPTSQHLSTSFASFTPSFSFNTSLFSQGLNTVVPSTSGPSMIITTLISSDTSVIPSPTSQHLSTSFVNFTPSFSFNTSPFSQGLTTVVPSTSGPSMFITTLISSVTSVIPSPTSQHLSTSFASFTPSFSFNTSPFSQGLNTVVPSTSGPSMFITTLISSDTSVIPSPTSQHLSTSFVNFTPSFSFNTSLFSQRLTTVVPSTSGPSMFITTLISSVTSVIPSPTGQHLSTSFAMFTSSFSFNTSPFSQGLNTVVPSTSGPSMFITTLISSVTSVIPSPTSQHLSTSFASFTPSFSFNTSLFSQRLTTVVPSTSGPSMFITTLISSVTSVIPSPTIQHLSTSFASFTTSFSFNTSPFSQGLTTVVPSTTEPFMLITTLTSPETSTIPIPTSQLLSSIQFERVTPSVPFSTSLFSQTLNTVLHSTAKSFMYITTLIFSSDSSAIPIPSSQLLSSSQFESFTPSFSYTTSRFSQRLISTSEPSMFITTLISSLTSVIPSPTSQHLSTSFASFTPSFSFNTSLFSQGLNTVVPSTSGPSMFISTLISSDTSVIPSPTSQHLSTSFASFTPSFSFNTSLFSQGLNTVVLSTSGPSMFITTLISSVTSVIPSPTSQHLSISFASFTPSFSFNTSLFNQGLNTVVPSTSGPSMFITTLISSDTSVIPSPTSQHLFTSFASFTPSFSYTTSPFSQGLTIVVPSTSGPSMFITTLVSSVTSVIPSPTIQHLSTSFASFTTSFSFNTSPFSQGLTTFVPSTSGPSMFITTLISSDTSVIPSPTSQHLFTSFASFTPSFSYTTSPFSQGLTIVVPSTSGPSMFITTLVSSVTSVIPSPTIQHLSTSFASFTTSFSFNTSPFSQGLTTFVPSTSGPSMFITTLISSDTSVIPSPTSQHLFTSFASFTPSFSYTTSPFSQGLTIVVPSTSGPSMFITTLISSVTSVIPSPTIQHLSTSFASFTTSFSFNTSPFSQGLTTVVPSTTEPFMLIATLTSPETSTIPIPTSQLLSSIQFERVTPSVPFSTSLFSQTLTTVLHSTTKSFMYITTLIFSSDSSAIPIPSSQLLSSSQFESFTPSFSYNTSRFSQRLTSTSEPSMFITTLISSDTSVIPSPTSQHLSTSFASFTPSFSFNTSLFSQGLNTVVPSTSGPSMFITTLISSDTSVIPSPTSQHLSTSFVNFTPSISFNTSPFSQGLNTVVPSTSGPSMFITTLISSDTSVIPSPTSQHLFTSFASFTPSFSYTTSPFSQGLTIVVPSTSGPSMFITTLISSVTSVIPSPTIQHLSTSFASFTTSFSFNTSPFSQGLNTVVPSTSGPFMLITTLTSPETSTIPIPTSPLLSSIQFERVTPSVPFSTSLFSQTLTTVFHSTTKSFMYITTLIFSSDSSAIPIPSSQLLSSSQFESFTPSFSYTTSRFSQRLTSTSEPSMFITTLISSDTSVIPSPTSQHLFTSFVSFTPSFSFNTSPFSQGLNTVVPSTSGPSMFITTLISSDTLVIPSPTSQHLSTSFASFTTSFSFNTSPFSQGLTTVVPSTTEPFMFITTLTSPETSTISIPTSQLLSSSQF